MTNGGIEYFGTSILIMGSWFDRAQILGYFARVGLMSAGFMCFAFLLTVGMDLGEAFGVINQFSQKVVEGGDKSVINVGWVLFGAFGVHYIAFFMIGWKKFKTTIDGDSVASDLFDDMNKSIIDKASS